MKVKVGAIDQRALAVADARIAFTNAAARLKFCILQIRRGEPFSVEEFERLTEATVTALRTVALLEQQQNARQG